MGITFSDGCVSW